jgi:hypothetical protein
MRRLFLAGLMLLVGPTWPSAQEKDPRPAAGVQDNSFLIEEAYNQEAGVIQHVMTLRRQLGAWAFGYTDEWPVRSQTHQFSYTVPYLWLNGEDGGGRGFGDVMLSYRYQALTESASLPAFAPRFSVILPTGDEDRGTGVGSYGYQINLPVSKIVADRVTLHGNAGVTSFFDVNGHQPTVYNLGGSVVYALTRNTNFLLEGIGEWFNDTPDIDTNFAFTLVPGIRHAFNFPNDQQLVLGVGMPIVFTERDTDVGLFIYASFEHKFR